MTGKKIPQALIQVDIDNLSHEGRGVARVDGKTVFVEGGLPGETVQFKYTRMKRRHAEGQVEAVLVASEDRQSAKCAHYAICGGCRLQHLHPEKQVLHKQTVLLEQLAHMGKVQPQQIADPILSSSWGYRRKARLGVKYVMKKGRVLVGFREKHYPYIADMSSCLVLHERIGLLITDLIALIESLTIRQNLPQIEVAMGDDILVLVFRVLQQPTQEDRHVLQQFEQDHQLYIYLQSGGAETLEPLSGEPVLLSYRLPEEEILIHFGVMDFTQVNLEVNRKMVRQAIDWLSLTTQDRVLDLFCGVGNFTLPISRHVAHACGVEGEQALTEKAQENARTNQSSASFHTANLYETLPPQPWMQDAYTKILLDPPRSGALQIIREFPKLGVDHIVYVSCNPATLARDAEELVHRQGYQLVKAGVIDMFPHTAHMESMALFQR